MTRRNQVIIGAIVLIIIALFLITQFEIRNVPDLDWTSRNNFDTKEPHDLYVFKELLDTLYGNENINVLNNDFPYDEMGDGECFISIGEMVAFSEEDENIVTEFIEAGNTAVFIGKKIQFNLINNYYAIDSLTGASISDSIDYTSNYNLIDYINSRYDTIHNFDFIPFDSTLNRYEYLRYNQEFAGVSRHRFNRIDGSIDFEYDPLGYATDGDYFFIKIPIGEGDLYIHTVPELFQNLGSKQPYYLNHFNNIFSHIKEDYINIENPEYILDKNGDIPDLHKGKPSKERKQKQDFFNQSSRKRKNSPLEYILSVPSLSWAYYLLALTLLLFVIFRGKRTQRIIPTIVKNKNTSMDYVKTLSVLHQNQKQNSKLVKHIREGFHHRIKTKYFLDHKDELYIEKLAAKSKIDLAEIKNLIHKLNSTGGEFSDDQLITLYKQIESFYNKSA